MAEVHAELLIGRKVVDASGNGVGRIEEMIAEHRKHELVIVEFHIGKRALWERLLQRRAKEPKKIKWRDLDLSDPTHPRLK